MNDDEEDLPHKQLTCAWCLLGDGDQLANIWGEQVAEAADEIDRLRAKVERLESRGINDMQATIAEQADEIDRLRTEIEVLRAERYDLRQEAARQYDEIDRLRAEIESGRQGFMALHWLERWRRGGDDD